MKYLLPAVFILGQFIQVVSIWGQVRPEVSDAMDEQAFLFGRNYDLVLCIDLLGHASLSAIGGASEVKQQGDVRMNFNALHTLADELGLTQKQLNKLTELHQIRAKKIAEVVQKKDLELVDIENQRRDIEKQIKQDVRNVFEDAQWERLRQIALQLDIRLEGLPTALVAGDLGKYLDIDEIEKRNVLNKAEEIRARLDKQIAELETQARRDLLDVLAKPKQQKLEELLGPPLQFQQPSVDWLRFQLGPGIGDASRLDPTEVGR